MIQKNVSQNIYYMMRYGTRYCVKRYGIKIQLHYFSVQLFFLLKIYISQVSKLRMVCLCFLIRLFFFLINTYVMRSHILGKASWSIKLIKLSYVYISQGQNPICTQCSMMFHFGCKIKQFRVVLKFFLRLGLVMTYLKYY